MHVVKESDNRFYINKSTQQNAGNGLFAKTDLKEGDYLTIVGVVVESRECVRYADAYNFVTQEGDCWIPLGFAALVNHATNPAHQNVKFDYINKIPAYVVTRDIKQDEEILTSYGVGFANLLAVYLTLNFTENFIDWQEDCLRQSVSDFHVKNLGDIL